jgi:hypothetical protein
MSAAKSPILDRISAAILLLLAGLELTHLVLGQEWANLPARIAACALLIVVIPKFGLREWSLLLIALALTAGLWLQPGGGEHVAFALSRGAYFTAFILLMMLLREAAATSDSVLKVGDWTTRQPPAKRYVAVWFSGHIAGILLNFGAVSLLAPLVQRGVRARPINTPEEEARMLIRERRQISALTRGFAMVITWAPTTLTQVIIFASLPGLDVGKVFVLAMGLAATMLALGWTEDRLRWGKPKLALELPDGFPGRALVDLIFVYAMLIVGAFGVQYLAGCTLPQALMSVAPMMLVGWVVSQSQRGVIASAPARLAEIFHVSIPNMARNAFQLGSAGYIGICAAKLAPVALIADWTQAAHIPDWALVAMLPVLITIGGTVALSPMVMVVFLAAVVSALPQMPADLEYIAIALGFGWALSITAAPNATAALLVAGATGIPSTTLTWKWNGVYSLCAMVVFAGLCRVMIGG